MKNRNYLIMFLIFASLLVDAQTRFERLGNFEKIILDKKIKNVILKKSFSNYIVIEGLSQDKVELSQAVDHLKIIVNDAKDDLSILIGSTDLAWIEGRADLQIQGAEVLSGGKGKFLVQSLGSENGLAFNFDFDFDFDNESFDYNYEWDFEGWKEKWETNFEWDSEKWSKEWEKEYKWDYKQWQKDWEKNFKLNNRDDFEFKMPEIDDIDIDIDLGDLDIQVREQIEEVIKEMEKKQNKN